MPVDSRGRQLFILFFYQLAFLVPRLFCLSEFDQAKQTSAPMPYTHAISLNSPLLLTILQLFCLPFPYQRQ